MMSTSNLNQGFVSNQTTICVKICGLDHLHKHGKTSLVEALLRHRRVPIRHDSSFDSRLEREKRLTFTSKLTSICRKDHIINMVDTPGHHDFIGEVRQGVSMANGAILVVDVNKGFNRQAERLVAEAVRYELNIILLLTKVDRFEASALEERIGDIKIQVWDVLVENDSTVDKLDFPVLHAQDAKGMSELLEAIIEHVPAPTTTRLQEPFKMMVSMIRKDDKWGRFMIGRIAAGVISQNDKVKVLRECEPCSVIEEGKVLSIRKTIGLESVKVEQARVGDIVSIGGFKDVRVGDTLSHMEVLTCLQPLVFEEPRFSMLVCVNDSPLAGQDCKKVSIEKLYDRLVAESERNPAFKVHRKGASVAVGGQGERRMGILLEIIRREGFELLVSRQQLTDGKHEGAIATFRKRVMVSNASGRVSKAALMRLQHLGRFFVSPGDEVYSGMIVGEHSQDKEITINLVQSKGPKQNVKLLPSIRMSLEEALTFVGYDEEIEVLKMKGTKKADTKSF